MKRKAKSKPGMRAGQSVPYGTLAQLVREELDRSGYLEPYKLAEATGHSSSAIGSAAKQVTQVGGAVVIFRGTYARPDVAEKILKVLEQARRSK